MRAIYARQYQICANESESRVSFFLLPVCNPLEESIGRLLHLLACVTGTFFLLLYVLFATYLTPRGKKFPQHIEKQCLNCSSLNYSNQHRIEEVLADCHYIEDVLCPAGFPTSLLLPVTPHILPCNLVIDYPEKYTIRNECCAMLQNWSCTVEQGKHFYISTNNPLESSATYVRIE
jgi:hypothetical protein